METISNKTARLLLGGACSLLALVTMNGCKKDNNDTVIKQNFTQVNLVANKNTYIGARVDPNFVNGWGIAFSPTGNAWISAEGAGTSVIYDKTGAQVLAAVTIPTSGASTGGAPSGQVFNASTDFVLPGGNPAKFIFVGTDGVISAWNTGGAAVRVIDNSATSAYTGLAIASDGTNNFIYAANFKTAKIDVFDKNFAAVTKSFTDPTLPAGYAPFNIQNVGGQLYVMYAKVDEATHDEEKGAGFGYVDIYNADGSFVKRFTSQGALNAPWGVAMAPSGFLTGHSSAILIGNFGDGRINAYDTNGNFLGSLMSGGSTWQFDGLWAITFAPSTATSIDPNWLFFTAGPNHEGDGLFGYLTP
jgi:uncharacterized protein (TIGR03118 family)